MQHYRRNYSRVFHLWSYTNSSGHIYSVFCEVLHSNLGRNSDCTDWCFRSFPQYFQASAIIWGFPRMILCNLPEFSLTEPRQWPRHLSARNSKHLVYIVLKFNITLNIYAVNHKKNVGNNVAMLAGKVHVLWTCSEVLQEAVLGECSKWLLCTDRCPKLCPCERSVGFEVKNTEDMDR